MAPIYRSASDSSFTTMNSRVAGRTEVYFCRHCGHLQTGELLDLADYYANSYEILTTTEYTIVDGRPVALAEHQARVLLSKVELRPGCRVLDYGCAKADTLRVAATLAPGIVPFLFDVTDKYIPLWERFPVPARWATHRVDPAWAGSMNVVLSFFALEHIPRLAQVLAEIRALLAPDGTFHFTVPNVRRNIGDFIVADHLNHFTPESLRHLLAANGFTDVQVDEQSHDVVFVVTARRARQAQGAVVPPDAAAIAGLEAAALEMARYWREAATRVQVFEQRAEGASAIYGAGFYGNFVAASLASIDHVTCFVDRNVHLYGRPCWGRPVVPPEALPAGVRRVLVGVNPRNARAAIESVESWRSRGLDFLYL
ncbi:MULTISPECIES: class I SAM-dependent methyltransferase [unclassified Cupriavidus]|uniref:class I SAM-dependent methyltransferase n=1 Tax=unclassified Cupriavidus TaxID=2640874 RepID=UPI0018D2CAC5|nr:MULTISPECIES: class I SAM-dependent methyltransferase [unclassified Cupriavidus]